jgi:hypothetical protein
LSCRTRSVAAAPSVPLTIRGPRVSGMARAGETRGRRRRAERGQRSGFWGQLFESWFVCIRWPAEARGKRLCESRRVDVYVYVYVQGAVEKVIRDRRRQDERPDLRLVVPCPHHCGKNPRPLANRGSADPTSPRLVSFLWRRCHARGSSAQDVGRRAYRRLADKGHYRPFSPTDIAARREAAPVKRHW